MKLKLFFLLLFSFVVNETFAQVAFKELGIQSLNNNASIAYNEIDSNFVLAYINSNNQLSFAKFSDTAALATSYFYSNGVLNEDRVTLKKSKLGNYYFGAIGDGSKCCIFKLDSNLQFVFSKGFAFTGGNQAEYIEVIEMPNGDFIASNGSSICRLYPTGNIAWVKGQTSLLYGFNKIIPLSNATFITVGALNNAINTSSGADIMICKFDSLGFLIWNNIYGTSKNEFVNSVDYNSNGNIVIGGKFQPNGSNSFQKAIICLVDTFGNLLQSKSLALNVNTQIKKVFINNSNEIFAFLSDVNNNSLLAKLNISLNLITCQNYQATIPAMICNSNDDEFAWFYRNSTTNNENYLVNNFSSSLPDCLTDSNIFLSGQNLYLEAFHVNGLLLTNNNSRLDFPYSGLPNSNTFINQTCINNCPVTALFNLNTSSFCLNDNTQIQNLSVGATNYQWYINDNFIGISNNLNYTFNNTGLHEIRLVASNGICSDTLTTIVDVKNMPSATFFAQSDFLELTAIPNELSADAYHWDFGNGNATYANDTVRYNYSNYGTYNLCLTAQNVCGSVTHCETVNVNLPFSNTFVKKPYIYSYTYLTKNAIQMANGNYFSAGESEYGFSDPAACGTLLNKMGNPMRAISFKATSGTTSDIHFIDNLELREDGTMLYAGYQYYFLSGAKFIYGIIDSLCHFNGRFISVQSQNDKGHAICALDSGNICFVYTYNNGTVLGKADPNANVLWRKKFAGTNQAVGLKDDTNGNLYFLCTNNNGAGFELVKTDRNGNLLWAKSYEGPNTFNEIKDFKQTSNGDFIISGANNNVPFILKVDTVGSIIWAKKYNLNFTNTTRRINAVCEASDGSIYFSISQSFSLTGSGFLCKAQADGTLTEAKKSNFFIEKINPTIDSGIVCTGENIIAKFTKEFHTQCNFINDTGSTSNIAFNAVNYPFTVYDPTAALGAIGNTSFASNFIPIDSTTCSSINNYLLPSFNFSTACVGQPVIFNNTSTGNFSSTHWYFPNAIVDTATSINATAIWNVAGTYNVVLNLFDSIGNTFTASYPIVVNPVPIANINDQSICYGTSVNIYTGYNSSYTFLWSPAIGLQNTTTPTNIASPLDTTNYQLSITSPEGCTGITDFTINVKPLPQLTAIIPDTICQSQFVVFYASGAQFYNWYAGTTQVAGGDTTSAMLFGNSELISLVGFGQNGCVDTISQFMFMDTCNITVGIETNYSMNNMVEIYPNLINVGQNIVLYSNQEMQVKFRLYNTIGQCVYDDNLYLVKGLNKVEYQPQASGMYMVQLEHEINSGKFLIYFID